ncbi:MAG: RNHCP domain-containing protein [Alphaproteobacteria bacterium]|nr:RNHCP domain-containing protein [Alphaproteobacteria bacterium]
MPKLFTRTVEDFDCANCGAKISGTGYTNHCPHCLCSKHVDINPGDRANTCGGLMRPSSIEKKGDEISIVHRCEKCGHTRKNKSADGDDFDEILKVMRANAGF